jgi:hypothetical protein
MRWPATPVSQTLVRRSLVLAVLLAALSSLAPERAGAQASVASPFDASYSLTNLGSPPGVPERLGGLTMKAGTTDRLLIGGDANESAGALWEIGVTRDASGHINGFTGTAGRFADAAFVDGGVTYGPGGVLFLSRWDTVAGGNGNRLGQTEPGSTVTDRVIDLAPLGVEHSPGSATVVPPGQPGAGSLKLASYPNGEWHDADLVPDGTGTYDLQNVTQVAASTLPGGPEGFVYVNPGSEHFPNPSILLSEFNSNEVAAYEVDANGDPVVTTRRTFVTGLTGAEGAATDPLTGDFLFSTFEAGAGSVIVVRGFAAQAGMLRVVKQVVNDNGGNKAPGDFSVHVRTGGADVPGSPQAGSAAGNSYTLPPGTYAVSEDPVAGYQASFGGDCNAAGQVTLRSGESKTCTITNDDVSASLPAAFVPLPDPTPSADVFEDKLVGWWKLRGSRTSAVFRNTARGLFQGQLPPPIWGWTPGYTANTFRPGGCYQQVGRLVWVIGFGGGGAWYRYRPNSGCRAASVTTARWFLNGPNGLRHQYVVDPDGPRGPAPSRQARLFWERTRPLLDLQRPSYNQQADRLTVAFRTFAHYGHQIELRKGRKVIEDKTVPNRDGGWVIRMKVRLAEEGTYELEVRARCGRSRVKETRRFMVLEDGSLKHFPRRPEVGLCRL